MKYCYLIFFFIIIQKTRTFLIVSMSISYVDDCLKKILLNNNTILYYKSDDICGSEFQSYDNPLFEPIPYEIGEIINVYIEDVGCYCGLQITTNVNDNQISTDNGNFWACSNCERHNGNYIYDNEIFKCYIDDSHDVDETKRDIYEFYFQIRSISDLGTGISEYSYYLESQNDFYIRPTNLNEKINLINLYSNDNLYAKMIMVILKPHFMHI